MSRRQGAVLDFELAANVLYIDDYQEANIVLRGRGCEWLDGNSARLLEMMLSFKMGWKRSLPRRSGERQSWD